MVVGFRAARGLGVEGFKVEPQEALATRPLSLDHKDARPPNFGALIP